MGYLFSMSEQNDKRGSWNGSRFILGLNTSYYNR
jgi:hypothetical protein